MFAARRQAAAQALSWQLTNPNCQQRTIHLPWRVNLQPCGGKAQRVARNIQVVQTAAGHAAKPACCSGGKKKKNLLNEGNANEQWHKPANRNAHNVQNEELSAERCSCLRKRVVQAQQVKPAARRNGAVQRSIRRRAEPRRTR